MGLEKHRSLAPHQKKRPPRLRAGVASFPGEDYFAGAEAGAAGAASAFFSMAFFSAFL